MTTTPTPHIFDYPAQLETARIVYLAVPWEATVSYGRGSALGPQAILTASAQQDLDDPEIERPYAHGLFLQPEDPWLHKLNTRTCQLVDQARQQDLDPKIVAQVNSCSDELNLWVENQTAELIQNGKIVGLIGGDHSVPYGAIKATAKKHGSFGILHFDAHHDLRTAYQGFTHSHASIMYNVLSDFPEVTKLVQLGIRDFCKEEADFAKSQGKRVQVFYDHQLKKRQLRGESWHSITQDIVKNLPKEVYISFDIDGLDPKLCPNTGTPVPGGMDFHEAVYVIEEVVRSGRRIMGFDLVEVAPGKDSDWDANVGMRLLYKLSAWTLASQGIAKFTAS